MPAIDRWVLNDPTDPQAPPGPVWWEIVHGTRRAISLRHPTYPVEASWDTRDHDALRDIAGQYLEKTHRALGLPPLFDKSRKRRWKFADGVPLAWLPLDVDEPADPRASFQVRREGGPPPAGDLRIVLLAVESRAPNNEAEILGSRLGIRITAHVARRRGGVNLRITGVACSGELSDHLTSVRPGVNSRTFEKFVADFFDHDSPVRRDLKSEIKAAGPLDPHADVWFDGVRLRQAPNGQPFIELYATVSRPVGEPLGVAHAVTARFFVPKKDIPTVEMFPLVAHAAPVRLPLFPRDPASMAGPGRLVDARPNRSPGRLRRYLRLRELPGIQVDAKGDAVLLDRAGFARVMRSGLVDSPETEIVKPATVAHPRMNAFAALGGYQGLRTRLDFPPRLRRRPLPLRETLHAYGLSARAYFRLARLPLRVRYRAPISPGPGKDGKTINAQVDYDPPDCDLAVSSCRPFRYKPLQVRFALADLKRSVSRREPLGLAADPRWRWHEYCHVLLAGVTGRLELVFTHSAGDALAAILNDPYSRLAWVPDSWMRGYTFPWVYLHRRHDRSVYDGWGWSGRYHRPARFDPVNSNCRHKGYDSEQILSASLFRLYRALGGDTERSSGRPDRLVRHSAADYTAYLILFAIGLLPWVGTVQLETPDQLVWLLTEADIGTWPGVPGPIYKRVGGCAHKVIRWAFEAQGLYATTDPLEVVDAPGKPPDVDVFIDDRRADAKGDYPRGGYMPVSLHADERRKPPDWHASSDAIQVKNRRVTVQVRNRGHRSADDVTVHVWWTRWPANRPLPDWDATKWTRLGSIGPKRVPPWPHPAAIAFGPFPGLPALPPGQRLLILAAATCHADPANNLATGLPCSRVPTPLVDLVAGDNNLGLRLYRVP
jgi:hypothetical protein